MYAVCVCVCVGVKTYHCLPEMLWKYVCMLCVCRLLMADVSDGVCKVCVYLRVFCVRV